MALRASRVIHRDIRPANLILSSDEHLKHIDFQFTISYSSKRRVSDFDRRNFYKITTLGGGYSPATCVWDDMYSIAKIMREVGIPPAVQGLCHEVESRTCNMRFKLPFRYRMRYKIRRVLSHLLPLRSWRRKFRHS